MDTRLYVKDSTGWTHMLAMTDNWETAFGLTEGQQLERIEDAISTGNAVFLPRTQDSRVVFNGNHIVCAWFDDPRHTSSNKQLSRNSA